MNSSKNTETKLSAIEQRDDALKAIKRGIIAGKYPPGSKLVEAALCAEFSLKRNRVREILQILVQEGFAVSTPYVGVSVSEISQKDAAQIYDLLGVLEGLALRVAAPLLSEARIDALEDMVRDIDASRDNPEEMFAKNRKFHQAMAECSDNERLINFVSLLRQQTRRISLVFFYDKDNADHSFDRHMDIIAALRSHDGQRAEEEIRKHYTDARDSLLRVLNKCV